MSERASQEFAIVATLDPDISTGKAWTTDVIDASLYDSIVFIVQTGTVSSSTGKVSLVVYDGTATGTVSSTVGSMAKTQSSTGDEDYQLIFDLDCADLTSVNHRYVKGILTVSGSTGTYFSLVALGFKPRFHPASDGDLASVKSIVVSS